MIKSELYYLCAALQGRGEFPILGLTSVKWSSLSSILRVDWCGENMIFVLYERFNSMVPIGVGTAPTRRVDDPLPR